MARRRHQLGRIIVRGKNPPVFVGRWREDVIQGEQTIRVERSMVLGTVAELKTKRIAQRLLDPILAKINSFDYRRVSSPQLGSSRTRGRPRCSCIRSLPASKPQNHT
jgi:hypothetical protein